MRAVIGRAAVAVLAFLLLMAGCSSGAPPQASPSHSPTLQTVTPSTPQDAARLRAFAVADHEQPWGMARTDTTWAAPSVL
jgi:hypothetical protein